MSDHRGDPRPRRRPLWIIFLAAVASAPVVVGIPAVPVGASNPSYVALGDSYASGPFIPDQQTNPSGCLRSDHNYAHLVAQAIGLNLTDVSCTGATTADLTGPQSTTSGTNPAQLNAVSKSTAVVTLSIGGDDLGFTSVIENCVALTPWGPTKSGLTCKSLYDPNGVDRLAAAIAATKPRIAAALQKIHTQAPNAKVFVVGYPDILPSTGDGCWPRMPFTHTDAPYLENTEVELNAMLSTVSASNGATYIDTYIPSEGFNACTAGSVRWIEPIVPTTLAAPVHPNVSGEAGMARIIEPVLTTHGA